MTFDPRALLPQDTPLSCPFCGAHTLTDGKKFEAAVEAREPREVWKHGARQQDRSCRACGHQWVTVLPPAHETGQGAHGTVALHRM